jgi:hypothetical protein
MVEEDQEFQNLSKADEEAFKDTLLAHRDSVKSGVRGNNRSAGQDYRTTVDLVNNEVCDPFHAMIQILTDLSQLSSLSERTGACAVAFFSRGHLDDTFEPNWIATPNAVDFVKDSLAMGPWDISRMLEQWACSLARCK